MGLDVYLYDGPEPDYETDYEGWKKAFDETQSAKSEKYPDHMCGTRYLRSSYNSGGFNSRVGDLLGEDLYTLFEVGDRYEWEPTKDELTAARERAVKLVDRIKAVERPLAAFDVNSLGFTAKSDAEAIKITQEQLAKENVFGGGWSCREGTFYPDGMKVIGFVPGEAWGQTVTYIVHEVDLEWYVQMAEIVVEFIDAALAMTNPRIHWSG